MRKITPAKLNWKLAFSALFGCINGGASYETRPELGAAVFIPKRLWRRRGRDKHHAPTTPTMPPPAAIGRAALAASGYAGAGAQLRFSETYELVNDQSLSGTPSSSGMSDVVVSRSPMQINFTSATMLTLDSQGQQYSLLDGDGDSVFEPISGGHPKVLAVIVEKKAALVMAIELTSAGQVDTTYSAIGPNTDPTAMPASGSAQYIGTVNAAVQPSVTPSAQLSEFSGTATFNVDFTANTVSGSTVYSQSSDPQFIPGSTILTVPLSSTSITKKNTFETAAGTAQLNQIPNHGKSFGPMRIAGDFFSETGGTLAEVFDGAGAYSSSNAA